MYVSLTFRDMTRTRLVLTGLLLAAACLPVAAHADRPQPLPNGPLGSAADVAAMVDLETKMNDNLQQGKAVPVTFATGAQVPGQVTSAGGWGDSGLWTGVYLGGEAMRYATARAHLQSLRGGDAPGAGNDHPDQGYDGQRDFWTEQRDQAMARIRTILAAEHRDITIAEDWQGTLHVPTVDPQGYPLGSNRHLADFGGVIPGQKGMIMRACTRKGLGAMGINPPDVHPDNPTANNSNRVYEITWKHGDRGTYYCETSPSRDTYAGVTFGLLTAYDLVGPDDRALRDQIRGDLQAMGDFLLKYGWNYPRPTGYVSASHDFDGFLSPLFVYVPMARLNLANAVRHVLDDGPDAVAKAKWDAVWAEELAAEGPQLAGSMEVDAAQPNDGYYKFNLHHLTAFNLLRTTTGAERTLIAQAVSVMDKTTGDDINAHFEAITYAATGETSRRDAAITHLREWLQYRQNTEGGVTTRNSARCGTELTCVPQDKYELRVDQAPGGAVTWFPGTSTQLRATRPLPVAQRPTTDFLWQRPSTQLDGFAPATWRDAGVDYLTPYWMLRYLTEVKVPALNPLPGWAGPAHY
jgi:hypothetical protein